MMMSGMVSLQVDPKGRLRIPSKYRSALGDENSVIYAMINSNGCLNIISKERAEEIITKLSKVVSIAVTERSKAARLILSSVSELKEDGQDRFTLPSYSAGSKLAVKEISFFSQAGERRMAHRLICSSRE